MCKASQPPNQSHWPGLTLQGCFLGAVTSGFWLVSVKSARGCSCAVSPCWSNLVLERYPRGYRGSGACQAVQVRAGIRGLTGRTGFSSRSRPTHKSGADQLIKLTLDTGCAPWPPSLFPPHSHLYNHLPFLCSSLFNRLLFLSSLCDTHIHTHTPHRHNSFQPNPHGICPSLWNLLTVMGRHAVASHLVSKCHQSTSGMGVTPTSTQRLQVLGSLPAPVLFVLSFSRFSQSEVTGGSQT